MSPYPSVTILHVRRVDVNAHVTVITAIPLRSICECLFSPSALKIVTAWSRNRQGYHPRMQPSFWGMKTHQDSTLCALVVSLRYFLVLLSVSFSTDTCISLIEGSLHRWDLSLSRWPRLHVLAWNMYSWTVLWSLNSSCVGLLSHASCQGITLFGFSEWRWKGITLALAVITKTLKYENKGCLWTIFILHC